MAVAAPAEVAERERGQEVQIHAEPKPHQRALGRGQADRLGAVPQLSPFHVVADRAQLQHQRDVEGAVGGYAPGDVPAA